MNSLAKAWFRKFTASVPSLRPPIWKLAQFRELAYHRGEGGAWRASEDFMRHTQQLFERWGYDRRQLGGQRIVDVGAGSRLRSRYFEGAEIIAIEPLAAKFRQLSFCDLDKAKSVFTIPAEERVEDLVGTASLVICINVLDHVLDSYGVLANCCSYLRDGGEFLLSVDLHPGEVSPVHLSDLSDRDVRQGLSKLSMQVLREFKDEPYGHGDCALTMISKKSADRNVPDLS